MRIIIIKKQYIKLNYQKLLAHRILKIINIFKRDQCVDFLVLIQRQKENNLNNNLIQMMKLPN